MRGGCYLNAISHDPRMFDWWNIQRPGNLERGASIIHITVMVKPRRNGNRTQARRSCDKHRRRAEVGLLILVSQVMSSSDESGCCQRFRGKAGMDNVLFHRLRWFSENSSLRGTHSPNFRCININLCVVSAQVPNETGSFGHQTVLVKSGYAGERIAADVLQAIQ